MWPRVPATVPPVPASCSLTWEQGRYNRYQYIDIIGINIDVIDINSMAHLAGVKGEGCQVRDTSSCPSCQQLQAQAGPSWSWRCSWSLGWQRLSGDLCRGQSVFTFLAAMAGICTPGPGDGLLLDVTTAAISAGGRYCRYCRYCRYQDSVPPLCWWL